MKLPPWYQPLVDSLLSIVVKVPILFSRCRDRSLVFYRQEWMMNAALYGESGVIRGVELRWRIALLRGPLNWVLVNLSLKPRFTGGLDN
jgi:hypothetical protein